jgi:hypothetical protein
VAPVQCRPQKRICEMRIGRVCCQCCKREPKFARSAAHAFVSIRASARNGTDHFRTSNSRPKPSSSPAGTLKLTKDFTSSALVWIFDLELTYC